MRHVVGPGSRSVSNIGSAALYPYHNFVILAKRRSSVVGSAAMPPARLSVLILVAVFSLLTSCGDENSIFLVGSVEQTREMRALFSFLEREKDAGENRFIAIQQVGNRLLNAGEYEKLILFMTTYVEKNPTDPYNAYYLGIVAAAYRDMGAVPMAVHYYERILKNHPDLLLETGSLHFQCLQELLTLVREPNARIEYYKELISRFGDSIDLGATYYFLARAYEEVGEWEQAIRVYQKFLKYPETEIPGFPRVHSKVREKVEFYYSDKSWTVENLDQLVAEIKEAIRTRNTRRLLRYKAKANFFTMSWAQHESDDTVSLVFDIGAFLQSSRVQTDDTLDIDSNAGEAFLRTTRWSYRIPTWYLYFRKVDFKPDPEINGRWEWAGIYFGEKL
jgi:tetratricopeptide (TPR) repeat protein